MKTVLLDDNLHAEIKIAAARQSVDSGKNFSITDYLNKIVKEHFSENGITIEIDSPSNE